MRVSSYSIVPQTWTPSADLRKALPVKKGECLSIRLSVYSQVAWLGTRSVITRRLANPKQTYTEQEYGEVNKEHKPCNCRDSHMRNHTEPPYPIQLPYPPPKGWLHSWILIFPRGQLQAIPHGYIPACSTFWLKQKPREGMAAFSVLPVEAWIHKAGIQRALSMCWMRKGGNWRPERSQNSLKVTEPDVDLYTTPLPICSFCGCMNLTKAVCFCKGVSSACFFSFFGPTTTTKKEPKKEHTSSASQTKTKTVLKFHKHTGSAHKTERHNSQRFKLLWKLVYVLEVV